MLRIFGKNNNKLFRNNSHKQTFSMPQPLQPPQQISKCACGFDYMAILTESGQLLILFQSKFHQVPNIPLLMDVATADNTIAMVTVDGQILVWDFDQDKLFNKKVNTTKIGILGERDRLGEGDGDTIRRVQMGWGDVFLISENGKVYHFKRNQWYETKSYSNIQSLQLSQRIIQVSSGSTQNLFLTSQGLIFKSSKDKPLYLTYIETGHKFMKVVTCEYSMGITKKGTLMIWGNSIHGNFNQPTQFTKLTKKFVDIRLGKQNGYAVADDGEVWVWGVNAYGELGISDYQTRLKPFPLITLEQNYVLDVFCGPSYACCLCSPEEKEDKKYANVLNRKTTTYNSSRNHQKLQKINHCPKISFGVQQMPQKIEINKSLQKQQSQNRSSCRSPSLTPKGRKMDGLKQKKSLTKQKENSAKINSKAENWLLNEKDEESNIQVLLSRNQRLELEINEVKEENYRLKGKVSEQQEVIADITDKIRLLEEAIDEHERTLTSRDHVLNEYQKKEKEYISHIDQLQRTIDQIIKSKEQNHEVMVIYDDLKSNFEKERNYYFDKIKAAQTKLSEQKQKYQSEICKLQKKQVTFNNNNKENSNPIDLCHSPISIKYETGRGAYEYQRRKQQSMEHMIDQIQCNKNRITRSANKLIALLDISQ